MCFRMSSLFNFLFSIHINQLLSLHFLDELFFLNQLQGTRHYLVALVYLFIIWWLSFGLDVSRWCKKKNPKKLRSKQTNNVIVFITISPSLSALKSKGNKLICSFLPLHFICSVPLFLLHYRLREDSLFRCVILFQSHFDSPLGSSGKFFA